MNTQPQTTRKSKTGFRYFRSPSKWTILILAGLIAVLYAGCGTIATKMVERADQRLSRNPETGVLIGAEERDLGNIESPRAVLFVHGFVGCGNNFAGLPERLANQNWRVRVLRLPGHGTTPFEFETTTPEELIEAVRRELLLLKENHETVVLIGHSMGCALSLIAASEEGADGVVLGAPYFGITYKWYYILPPRVWNTILSPCLRWVYKTDRYILVNRKEAKPQIISYRWIPTKGITTLNKLGQQAESDEIVSKITCPVFWSHARQDEAASFQSAKEAFDRFPATDKEFLELKESNHHIYWDYEQEELMTAIEKFLNERYEISPSESAEEKT